MMIEQFGSCVFLEVFYIFVFKWHLLFPLRL